MIRLGFRVRVWVLLASFLVKNEEYSPAICFVSNQNEANRELFALFLWNEANKYPICFASISYAIKMKQIGPKKKLIALFSTSDG